MTSVERYVLVVRPAEYGRFEEIQPIKGKLSGLHKETAGSFNRFVKLFKTTPILTADSAKAAFHGAASTALKQVRKFEEGSIAAKDIEFCSKLLLVITRIERLIKVAALDAHLDASSRRVVADLAYSISELPKTQAKRQIFSRLHKLITDAYSFSTVSTPRFLENSLGWMLKEQSEDNIALRAILALKPEKLAASEVAQTVARATGLIKKGFRQSQRSMPEPLQSQLIVVEQESSVLFSEALSVKQQYCRTLRNAIDMAYAHKARDKFLEKSLGHWLHWVFSGNRTLLNIQQRELENLASDTLIKTAQVAIALIEKGFYQKDEPIPASLNKLLNQLKSGF